MQARVPRALSWSHGTCVSPYYSVFFFLFFFSVILKYNFHTIQFTHFMCTIQGLLVYSELCIHQHNLTIYSSPQKETSHPSAIISQFYATLSPRQPPIYFLSLQIPLFWTFYIKGTPQEEVLWEWLVHGVARIRPSFLFMAK